MKRDPMKSVKTQLRVLFVNYGTQTAILGVLAILISLFFPWGTALKYSYKLNDVTREPIIAPYTFPILKTQEKYQADLDAAKRSVPFEFFRNQELVDQQTRLIEAFFTLTRDIRAARKRLNTSRDLVYRYRYEKEFKVARADFVADSTQLANLMTQFQEHFTFEGDPARIQTFLGNEIAANRIDLDAYQDNVLQICRNRWAEGIYNIPFESIKSFKVLIRQGDIPVITNPGEFQDLTMARIKATREIAGLYRDEKDLERVVWDGVLIGLMKPNLEYDAKATERRQEETLKTVPRFNATVLNNELIVDGNMRVTEEVLLKLESLSLADRSRQRLESGWEKIIAYLGRLIVIAVVVSFFFTFLILYRTYIYNDTKMVLLIALIMLVELVMAYLIVNKLGFHEYLIPVTVAGMVLTILFDARIGFMATASITIMTAIMIGNNMDFVVVALFTSSVAMYNVRELRTRSQLFTTIFSLIFASILVAVGLGLFKTNSWETIRIDLLYLLVLSVLAPIVTYGLVGLIEIAFGITTDLTLLELLDFNHPLLKRLQQEANGTFNHSVVVGNLAEGCADAIGARALLCRVGAYYHDIGKMSRPEYFIENQFMVRNRHDTLTPVMSAKIIVNHVKEGLKMADEYGLPRIVRDFIPMHHGTTRTNYFYHKALQEAEEGSAPLDENLFRYPGPKPNSKETGILMICEAVEAAVRSLKDPDVMKIDEMVDKIIQSRIADGQLDECPLTLDELRRIKGKVDGTSGMLPILRGIYHIRIEYPEEVKKTQPAEPRISQ